MKLTKLLAPVVILLLLAACATSDKLALQLNFQKGKKYYYTTTSEQNVDQTFMGQSMKNSKKTTTGYIYEIKDINKDGNYNVTITYDKVETEKSEDTDRKSPIPDDFLKGFSFDMVVTPKGKVTEIKGMDKLMDAAINAVMVDSVKNDTVAQAVMKPVMDMIKNQFSDKNMSSMMEQMTNYFPEGEVEVGDKWENVANVNTVINMKITTTYKVIDIANDVVKLDVDAKIATGEGEGIMGMKMDLNGTQKGTMEIDSKSGLVLKSSVKQDIDGKINVMGMDVPMKISGTNTLEAKEMN